MGKLFGLADELRRLRGAASRTLSPSAPSPSHTTDQRVHRSLDVMGINPGIYQCPSCARRLTRLTACVQSVAHVRRNSQFGCISYAHPVSLMPLDLNRWRESKRRRTIVLDLTHIAGKNMTMVIDYFPSDVTNGPRGPTWVYMWVYTNIYVQRENVGLGRGKLLLNPSASLDVVGLLVAVSICRNVVHTFRLRKGCRQIERASTILGPSAVSGGHWGSGGQRPPRLSMARAIKAAGVRNP